MQRLSFATEVSPKSSTWVTRPRPSNVLRTLVCRSEPLASLVRVSTSSMLTMYDWFEPSEAVGALAHGVLIVASTSAAVDDPIRRMVRRATPANWSLSTMSGAMFEPSVTLTDFEPPLAVLSPFMPRMKSVWE